MTEQEGEGVWEADGDEEDGLSWRERVGGIGEDGRGLERGKRNTEG